MNKWFYTRLAVNNMKKNSKTYIPYILTCIMTVMMFYIMRSLSKNPGIKLMAGDDTLYVVLNMGCFVVALFSFIFLFYTNSFLMKQRQKEFGVFHILGMEKRHLAKVILIESIIVMVSSLGVGIVLGIALDKAMFLLIAKMMGATVPLGFFISSEVIRITIEFFVTVFFVILLKSIYMLRVSNATELLRGGNVGEKEPKTRWIMALLGIVGIAVGYYLALTTKNPIASIYTFFIAVIIVIISTYLLFVAGSIALLKLLKKKKSYYYQTRHFISISGMIYRMKRNAVGLANICILSTMVLVMVSSTTSMMVGFEDIMNTRYPNDFAVYSKEVDESRNKAIVSLVRQMCEEYNLPVEKEIDYSYLNVAAIRKENTFVTEPDQVRLSDMDGIYELSFSTIDDYNRIMGEKKTLQHGEILIHSNRDNINLGTMNILNHEYKVVEVLDDMYINGELASNIATTIHVIVPDIEELKELNKIAAEQKVNLGLGEQSLNFYYGFDTSGSDELQQKFNSQLKIGLSDLGFDVSSESRLENRTGMLGMYGGLFFLGIFLGALFIMATVLIIYYKQISEGYEDRERFAIMQKVGLSKSEVKKAIHSQVLTVFFLPLIVAGIHLMAAFPLISKILALLNMQNTRLYIICIASCYLVFAVVYVLIYSLTAKVYYKIVSA